MPNPNGNPATLRPPWKRGQSGNARGANRGYRRTLKAAREASPEAMETIIACMRDTSAPWPARVRAAELVIERAWGAPNQALRLEAADEGTKCIEIKFVSPDGTERDHLPAVAAPVTPLRLVPPW